MIGSLAKRLEMELGDLSDRFSTLKFIVKKNIVQHEIVFFSRCPLTCVAHVLCGVCSARATLSSRLRNGLPQTRIQML